MLTKDLIKFRRQKDRIKPTFIQTDDWRHLKLAEQLLSVYANAETLPRNEISDQVTMIVNGASDLKFAKGLNKLCLDRTEFAKPGDFDYVESRREVFLRSAKLLSAEEYPSYDDYQMTVRREAIDLNDFIENGLYGDLPQNETLIKFKNLTPEQLLQRYNCSLVQSLLLYSGSISLELQDADSQKLRRLFKYLKFFRLLAEIRCEKFTGHGKKKQPFKLTMKIDGPVSLFENTSKYGLQLACFFPALPDLDRWRLQSEIKLNNTLYTLDINQKSELVSHYRNFTSYVPEEIRLFHSHFKEKQDDWQITGQTPFINIGKGEIIFPDLSFKNKKGKIMHLELFHRWHMAPLIRRLEQGAMDRIDNLIVGVDRSLMNKGGIKEALEESQWFAQRGFYFRDFPGVATVLKRLKAKG